MPDQVAEMLLSGRIYFVLGNMTKSQYGVEDDVLRRLEKEVTIIINAAANISLKAPLRRVVQDNCLSALELAHMACRFTNLSRFIQVSSAYALSDLPDGPMDERIYPIQDAERQLEDILSGEREDWMGFAWPYAKSKRLMECLMHARYAHRLPLLIVRPTGLGPALTQPCEMYGPVGSCPVSTWFSRMMHPAKGAAVFPATKGSESGTAIFDELPVDLASNIILQHIQLGTRGVIHTSSQSYIPKTFDQFVADLYRYVPEAWKTKMATIVFSTDANEKLSPIAEFFAICDKNWLVRAERSKRLETTGLLGVGYAGHEIDRFTEKRVRKIFKETMQAVEAKQKGALAPQQRQAKI